MQNRKPKKIHIIGAVGSGKTTFARRLSEKANIAYYELDNVVWKRRKDAEISDVRRSPEERDAYFAKLLRSDKWIVEGTHSDKWVLNSVKEADVVILLDPSYVVRVYRIIRRFILQKLGREEANYLPSFKIFRKMFKWNKQFEEEKQAIVKLIHTYNDNLIVLQDKNAREEYMKRRN